MAVSPENVQGAKTKATTNGYGMNLDVGELRVIWWAWPKHNRITKWEYCEVQWQQHYWLGGRAAEYLWIHETDVRTKHTEYIRREAILFSAQAFISNKGRTVTGNIAAPRQQRWDHLIMFSWLFLRLVLVKTGRNSHYLTGRNTIDDKSRYSV